MRLLRPLLFLLLVSQIGCASFGQKLKAFINGEDPNQKPKKTYTTYSENPNLMMAPKRQYKRTTRSSLEKDANLNSSSGSLWVMEGQGAYLFSQNIVRMIGDSLMIQLDGEARTQVTTKVDVIKTLLDRFEQRRNPKPVNNNQAGNNQQQDGGNQQQAQQNNRAPAAAAQQKQDDFEVKTVPTRIVERTVDGNYRVKGSQPFMIGKREYKVIVTGIIKAEDFNDEGVSSTKLLDPKYDIVSNRKSVVE